MLINIHTHHRKLEGIEILNSSEFDCSYFSYGIGPFELEEKVFEELYLYHNNCLSIGEIGLDKLVQININKQITEFKNQLIYSEKLNLPVIIHCVKSFNELIEIKRKLKPTQPWIIHGFRKTTLLENLLNEDFYISIGTAILFDEKLQAIIKKIPDNRIFLETDNDENHSIQEVYLKIASLKEISLLDLEEIIFNNFKTVFTKWGIG
jgi:TatD DNase family protein